MKLPNTSLEFSHFPVMLQEVIEVCEPVKGKFFLDCTFGGGGYSSEILKHAETKVIALDRDSFVINYANKIKKKFPERFFFYNEKFSNLEEVTKDIKIDTVIFDLGLSSFQLKDLTRGFSFKSKDKLDMCMGLSSLSAEKIINTYSEKTLKQIIKVFGEEKEANRIVKRIIRTRKEKKISTVSDLVEIIEKSKKKNFSKKINVSTKTFQALRIFVNKETTELLNGITKATKILKPGGKILIISFHSIEDKIIKFFFKHYSANRSNPSRYLPEIHNKSLVFFEDYKNHIITASLKEIKKNPSSRSAKLRYAIRNNEEFYQPDELLEKFKKYSILEGTNE